MTTGLIVRLQPKSGKEEELAAVLADAATSFEPRRELARRVSGGIEIRLYWSAALASGEPLATVGA